MSSLLWEAGNITLSHFVQFTIGFVLSIMLYYIPVPVEKAEKHNGYVTIIAAALLGMLFPLGIYGLIPIIVALSKMGFRFNTLLPFLLSNTLFNSLVPFYDPSFTWRTGMPRVILAFLAGVMVGLVVKFFRYPTDGLLRINFTNRIFHKPESAGKALIIFFKSSAWIGISLIIGVCANLLIQRLGFSNLIHLMYTPQLSHLSRYFMILSAHPLFLLAMIIVTSVINPIRLSAIFMLLKTNGISLYIGYLSFLTIILVALSMVP